MPSKNPPMNLYKKIVFSFIGLVIILVLVVLYISFASVRVNIKPVKEVMSANVLIDVAENPTVEGVLYGQILSTEVEGSQIYSPTGTRTEEGTAEGTITIYNNYTKDQPLVEKTRFLSPDGFLFRLKKTVLVPAGGQLEAEIYADEPGTKYEIGPTKFTIPGLWSGLQEKIYAESVLPMKGGTREVGVVQDGDIEKAKNELSDKLFTEGLSLLQAMSGGEAIPSDMAFKEVLESSIDSVEGEEVESFTAHMTLRIIGIITDEDMLTALAETKLRSSLPEDKKLISIVPNSLKFTLEKYDLDGGMANLKVYMEGISSLQNTSLILDKSRLVGLDEAELRAYLESLDDIEDAVINFSPFWVRKVPSLKDHIKINIE